MILYAECIQNKLFKNSDDFILISHIFVPVFMSHNCKKFDNNGICPTDTEFD